MKIAYILEVDPFVNSGIIKKVNDQINYWKEDNNQVLLLIIWPNKRDSKQIYLNGKLLSTDWVNKLKINFLKNYLNKIFSLKKVKKELSLFQPDILYIRQNIWYPGISSMLAKYNTILEINSVDKIEMVYSSKLKRTIYNFGRERILKVIKAIIVVTPSILEHYQKYDIKKTVVSNGIDLSRVKPAKNPEIDRSSINLVFVGSNNMKWHGIERIFELARIFMEYKFHIVGYYEKDFSNIPNNIKFYGWIGKEELKKVYTRSNFGIGSFGNTLVGKSVDSTLKVREYLAYGLPVILGHVDVDFQESTFLYKITDSNNNLLPIEQIRAFINKNKDLVVSHDDLKIIDSVTKEKERLKFFSRVQNEWIT